jgi:hypothetical protein
VSNVALIFNTAVVESLLLWRLYIIWSPRTWIVVPPFLLFLGTLGAWLPQRPPVPAGSLY